MYGQLPSPIAVLTLDQDQDTGKLSLVKYHNVDTSGVKGLWITCGASLSPWNTHLSSEEYEPDATLATNSQLQGFSQNLFGDASTANPYDYGHLPEVTVNADGTGSIKKHYCLGRISHELVQVMPDNRTVLMGDDATNGGLFMFVADKEKDLSAGTLYVAKWTQSSSVGAGAGTSAGSSWAGHQRRDQGPGGRRHPGQRHHGREDHRPGRRQLHPDLLQRQEELGQGQAGMEKAAAFLETHRYAALMGAAWASPRWKARRSTPKDKKAYSAMSAIKDRMVTGNVGNPGDIKLDKAINAGACTSTPDRRPEGHRRRRHQQRMGAPMQAPAAGRGPGTADALGNLANADKIANPDNLKFSEKMRTLFIGEDSGMHVNNFLWAYNVDTKTLSRVSVPAGAESTGLHAVDEINGWTYVMSNFQHPGDWESPLHDVVKPRWIR
jgi:secreted PhoX family phosphatase